MNLFTRLNVTSDDADLPIISRSDIRLLYSPEQESYDHWMLGGGASSLIGIKSGTSLTPKNSAPTYFTSYATLGGYQQSLLSGLTDRDGLTMCVVVRDDNFDNINKSIVVANSGAGLSGQALSLVGGVAPYARSVVRGNTPLIRDRAFGAISGDWYFLAMSQEGLVAFPYIGGAANAAAASSTSKIASTFKVALGNTYEAAAVFNNGMSIAEFIIFERGLSVEEIDAVYGRSKSRMAERGIDLA